MRLTWLAEALRADGLPVVEVPGWQGRGKPFAGQPAVVVGHHTATSGAAKGDLPTLRILVDGRSDLPGPLCQLGLSRSGVFHVIADGRANHAGRGKWASVTDSARTVGIEAEHPGIGHWPAEQLDAFDRGVACLLRNLGQPASHYCGHREWALPAGRKVDPAGIDLNLQRWRIAALLSRTSGMTKTSEEFVMASKAELAELLDEAVLSITGGVRAPDKRDPDTRHVSNADVLTAIDNLAKNIDTRLRALEAR